MIDAIDNALSILKDVSYTDFIDSRILPLAISRLVEIVGEAAARIPREFTQQHQHIDWVSIIDLRNEIIHDYSSYDDGANWQLVKEDFPILLEKLEKLLNDVNSNSL